LSLVAIFGLNYFDKLYVKFVIVLLLVSLIMDLFWLIFKAGVTDCIKIEYVEPRTVQ
jgi:hypothetical protein